MPEAGTIVVGYDGSPSADRAVDRAARLSAYGSLLVIAHVAPDASRLEDGRALLDQAEARLVRRDLDCRRRQLVGNPATELIALATELEADLIVVGNGKTAPQRLLSGSVSTVILHQAPCDVLVAR